MKVAALDNDRQNMYTCIVWIFICNVFVYLHVCIRFTWGGRLQVGVFVGVGLGAIPPSPTNACFRYWRIRQVVILYVNNTIWMFGSRNWYKNFLPFFLKYFYTWLRFFSCEREKQRTITLINKKKFLYRKSPVHIEIHRCDGGGEGGGACVWDRKTECLLFKKNWNFFFYILQVLFW